MTVNEQVTDTEALTLLSASDEWFSVNASLDS